MSKITSFLKKLPVDLGQAEYAHKTKGKLIALDLVPPENGKKALDIGCREGKQSEWLKNQGYSVEAIDIEPQYPAGKKVDVEQGLPYDDNSFDLIWCSEVLEHLEDPAYAASEMRRVLKEEGDLILTTPNSNFWFYRILRPFGITARKLQQPGHKHFFSLSELKNIFPEAQFYGYFPYNLIKLRLKNNTAIDFLSPTFVIHEKN